MTAIGATALSAQLARSDLRAAAAALEREATEIGRTVDAAVRAAHDRADSMARAPMLRAAVLTDAATVADLMNSEFKLDLAPGEVAELFQIEDANLASLFRIPAGAPALPTVRDRRAAIARADASGLRIVVGAHIDRLSDSVGYDTRKAGMLVLSAPVDLGAVRRQLSERTVDATLAEAGASIRLVHRGTAAGDPVRLAVPSETMDLTLTVAPLRNAPDLPWLTAVRGVSLALGALLVIAYVGLRTLRRARAQVRRG